MVEKISAEYQDKLNDVGEELAKARRDLKDKTKANDELRLEVDYLKAQISNIYISCVLIALDCG